jgi:RNA polymerase-binding transcription factor DksA
MGKRKRVPIKRKPKASTKDVVGKPLAEVRVPQRWRPQYKRLLELREYLLHRQVEQAKDALEEQPSFSTHMADAGTDTYDRDFALGMLSSEQDALYEIEEAINRIQTGTYGKCEITGKPIEPARLEAIPWTRFSAAAEKQLESEGSLKRAALRPSERLVRESAPTESEEE